MFKRYSFKFSASPDKALAKLDRAVAANSGFSMKVDANDTVKLFRDQGMVLLNGFFPVFVGRFNGAEGGSELRGGFRFHLIAIAIVAVFVTTSVASLANLAVSPDVATGLPEDWKWRQMRFELQFIGFTVLAAVFAWLAGKPMRERIVQIIESATTS